MKTRNIQRDIHIHPQMECHCSRGLSTMAKAGPDGNVYCCSESGDLIVLDRQTGRPAVKRLPILL